MIIEQCRIMTGMCDELEARIEILRNKLRENPSVIDEITPEIEKLELESLSLLREVLVLETIV